MSSIVLTIHNFDFSSAGFSTAAPRTPSCHPFAPSRRPKGPVFIHEAANRNLRNISADQYLELRQRAVEICGGDPALVIDSHACHSTQTVVPNGSNPKFSEVRL